MSTNVVEPTIALVLKKFVAVVAAVGLLSYATIYSRPRAPVPLRSDGYSYYVYLPSWFLYHDVTLESPARDCCGGTYPPFTSITRWPATGRLIDPHPIGPAMLMAPFFLAAHLLTRWSNLSPDGFSLYYQHAAGLAGLAYLVAGLAILRGILCRHFTAPVALATLVATTWGTNLFHYGVYDSTFSHVYSFFLVAALLAIVELWWLAPTPARTIALGLSSGLLVVTRHTNAIFLLLIPLYGVSNASDLRRRMGALWTRRGAFVAAMLVATATALPQFAIYKMTTGSWIVSAYSGVDAGFRFASPRFGGVLFSTQKGLFFWSPVLLLAVVGLFTATGWPRLLALPAMLILMIDTYLIASWSDWQFGGSYGHRGFTDSLALFAVFLAGFFAWAGRRPRLIYGVGVAASAAVALCVAQMIQYWLGILPIADTSWDQYRSLFMRFR